MHITLAHYTKIPVNTYGGTERILWWLGKELVKRGHRVTYLVKKGSDCSFAVVREIRKDQPLNEQLPQDSHLVHFFFQPRETINRPFLVTNQGNVPERKKDLPLADDTVFVSKNHAERHGASCYVYNGIDPKDYSLPDLSSPRTHFHFLAKASWKAKNLRDAVRLAEKNEEELCVLGGNWWHPTLGLRYLLHPRIALMGMVDDQRKSQVLMRSKGLIFPVLWNEPFGIAMVESLYFGCPVFGTPFGSLPELINEEVGFLSASFSELIEAISSRSYSTEKCHDYVMNHFTVEIMVDKYLKLYEKVLQGKRLNRSTPSAKGTKTESFPKQLL